MKIDANLLVSVGVFLVAFFGLYFSTKNGNREFDSEQHEQLKADAYKEGKIDSKLDSISSTVSRIDGNIENMKKDISNMDSRLNKVEDSTKKAHERLDAHIGKGEE